MNYNPILGSFFDMHIFSITWWLYCTFCLIFVTHPFLKYRFGLIYLKLPVIVMAVVPFHNAVKHVICSSIFVGKHFMPSFYTKAVHYYILLTSQCGIPWIRRKEYHYINLFLSNVLNSTDFSAIYYIIYQ